MRRGREEEAGEKGRVRGKRDRNSGESRGDPGQDREAETAEGRTEGSVRQESLRHLVDRPRRVRLPQSPVTPPSLASPWKETDVSSNPGLSYLCSRRVPRPAGAPTSHSEAFEEAF